jgi:long-chain fatty acid transport protein
VWAAVAALAAMVAGPAAAAGLYAQEQSVEGLGRAYSGEAAGAGADAMFWNPAAIADVQGASLYNGLQVVAADVDVTNRGSTITRPGQATAPVGGNPSSEPFDISEIPNFAAAKRVNEQWAVGLAITAPFGFAAVSPKDAWTRYEAIKVRLIDIDLQPTIAWRPTPWLNLGVGGDAEIADAKFSTALPNLSAADPDGRANTAVNGWNFGWIAGAQVKAGEAFTLGLSYRSAISHSLGGHATAVGLLGPLAVANGQVVSQVRFSTPWLATLGASWRFAPRWTLEAQAQRVGWSAYSGFAITDAGLPGPPAGQRASDTTSYAVGVDYAAAPFLTFRAGVQTDPRAIKDSAVLPDGSRLILAAGASLRKSARKAFDVGVAYVSFAHTPILSDTIAYPGTPFATPVHLVGDLAAHALVLSVGMRQQF